MGVLLKSLRNLAILATLACCSSAFAQQSFVRVTTNAYYQGLNGGINTGYEASPFSSNPAHTMAQSSAIVGGDTGIGRSDRTTCYDESNAWGEVFHPGQEHLFARAGGWSPGNDPPEDCFAETTVEVQSWWMATSASSDPIPIDIFYFLEGWLFTAYYTDESYASIDIKVDIADFAFNVMDIGATLGGGSGLATTFNVGGGAFSDAGWVGAWSNTTSTLESTVRGDQDKMFDLNYAEGFNNVFDAPANTPFQVNYKIRATAKVPGPFEIFSNADFSNTGSLSLRCDTAGVELRELNLVPEPGAFLALGLGFGCLLRRTRR